MPRKGKGPSVEQGPANHHFFPPEHPTTPTPPYLFPWPPAGPSISVFRFRPPSLTWRVTCLAWCLLLGWYLHAARRDPGADCSLHHLYALLFFSVYAQLWLVLLWAQASQLSDGCS